MRVGASPADGAGPPQRAGWFERPVDPVDNIALPPGMVVISQTPEQWIVRIEGEVGALLPVLARLPVRDLDIAEPALEDVLRSFYRVSQP